MTTVPLSVPVPSVLEIQKLAVAAEKCLAWLGGRAPTPRAIEVFYKADAAGRCRLPGCRLSAVGSVPVQGLTGSAAAAACSHCCAHL